MPVIHGASFNGVSSKLTIANYTGNATSFSVAMWVNLTANQVQRVFFENYQVTGPKGWGVGVHDTVTNKLKFYLNPNVLASATTLSITTWYYVVFTYDGTTAKIYLNGSSTPDATLVTALSYGTVPANNNIGSLSGTSQWFNGSLAAVGYWSKVLTTTEMANLYNSGNGMSFADLSGSLLTSLGSYHDFNSLVNLGLDSSTNARNYTPTNVSRVNVSTIPYGTVVVADSPVSYWKTDETTGTTIHDSVDGNDLGQVNSSTLNQTGPGTLKAIDFSPGGWLVPITLHTLNLQITGNITLEAWAKLASAPVTNARSIILDRGYTSNTYPFDNYCLFAEDSSGCFGIGITIGTTLYEAAGTSPPIAGAWYHLCGTYDGTNLKFYQNGVLQNTTAVSGAIRNDDSPLTIASANRPTLLSNPFVGSISNIAIYNTALTSTRVAVHYNTISPVNVVVSQIGVLVVDTGTPNVRTSQTGVLVVDVGTPNVRLSQFGLSVIYTASPNVRVSQSGILSIYTVTPKVRDSRIGALVVATGSPKVRDSQIGALIVAIGSPKVRDSQIGALVVVVTASTARISQEGMLVVYQGTPTARISQAGMLVVYPVIPPGTWDNIASYWPLDEVAGVTRIDKFNGSHLADFNTVGSGTGLLNGDATFNGSNKYLSVASNSNLQLSGNKSFIAWVKLTSTAADGTILSKWKSATGYEYVLQYIASSNRFIFAQSKGTGSPTVQTATANIFGAVSVGVWYFVAAGVDHANSQIWISINAGTKNTAPNVTPYIPSATLFSVGRNEDGPQQYWNGDIDEIGMWSRVLSLTDLTTLYNAGTPLAFPAVALDYTFTSLTTAIGAGTPSRAFSLTLIGMSSLPSSASFALSDGGVGGVFFPASPIVMASGSAVGTVTQFVYTAPVGTTGTVTITVVCTGGLTGTKTVTLSMGVATIFVRDTFTDTVGTALDAHVPDIGGAWIRQPNALAARYSLNGVGGLYQSVGVAVGTYAAYLNATLAATTEYDVQADSVVKDNTYITAPLLVIDGNSGGTNLTSYTLMAYNTTSGQGWYGHRWANGTATILWGPVNSPTVTPGTYTGSIATRMINGNQYLFYYVNNVLKTAPFVDNTLSNKGVGFCTNTITTSAQTPTNGVQIGNLYARNTDWTVPAPTSNGSCLLMGM